MRHERITGNGGLKVAAAMADKPVQRASIKEKLEAFKVRAAGAAFWKVMIDLAGISGDNGFEVIYLLGMAFAFPANIQQEVYGCGHRNKECGECGGQRCTVR